MVFPKVFFSTNLVLLGLVWSFVKFGKVLIDGCSDTCYNKKLIETFRQICHKKSKANENPSDHFIVSKEILKTDSFPSLHFTLSKWLTSDRYISYQNDMAGEPDFCRDIIETRIKGILKEHLKISRDITFLQVGLQFYPSSQYMRILAILRSAG